jgi:uncharacterized protein (DUF2236 family)
MPIYDQPSPLDPILRAPDANSIVWQRACDWRILIAGGRSLVLQVAHPVVAAGVAQHSNFAADPWRRLIGTLEMYVGGVLFGWPDGALNSSARLRKMHERISGVDLNGRQYHALQPDAFAWVHATLVDGLFSMLERFGSPLRGVELDQYYDEMREVGRLLGVRDQDMPPNWARFHANFDEITRTVLQDNQVVRQVLATLMHAPRPAAIRLPSPLWDGILWPAAGHFAMLSTVGLLPPVMRERLGLQWTRRQEFELNAHAGFVRRIVPLLPSRVRLHPWAYAAFQRTAGKAAA